MTHIASTKVSEDVRAKIEGQMVALLSTTSTKTRKKVFSDLLTDTEKLMIAKRLSLIYFIGMGLPTHTISKTLKMSPSTVARFEQRIERGACKETIKWLKQNNVESKILTLLGDLIAIPLADNGKPMSLKKFLDEKL